MRSSVLVALALFPSLSALAAGLPRLLPLVLAVLSCDASTPEPAASPIAAAPSEPATPATTAAATTAAPATPTTPAPDSIATARVEELTRSLWRIDEVVLTELALDAAGGRLRCRVDGAGGCVIEEMAADSVARSLGLHHADRLQRIAGLEVTDATSLRAALHEGRRLGVVEVSILRDGQTLRQRYRLRTTLPLRPADEKREKGLDVLGEAIVPGEGGAVVIDVAALPSLAAALPSRAPSLTSGRVARGLPRILGLGEVRWTRVTRDGQTSTVSNVASGTLVDEAVEALVGGREVTFGFDDDDGNAVREIRVTAREDVVDPTIIALAASLLDTPASASSLDPAAPAPPALDPAASAPSALTPLEGITAISDTEFTITRAAIAALTADPMVLARAARVVPSPDGGMKFYGIRRSSAGFSFAQLGLRNGDRLVAVNGLPFDGPEAALEAYGKLRKSAEFRLTVDRRGAELELVIRVVE
jgi:type II secretory pathway component PulC